MQTPPIKLHLDEAFKALPLGDHQGVIVVTVEKDVVTVLVKPAPPRFSSIDTKKD